MEVIALEGNPNIGKTTTLNIVYQLLLQAGYTQVKGTFIDLNNNDCLDVLQGELRIGIVTQGDYAVRKCSVKNHLLHLQSLGCNKVICACTLGVSKQKIKDAIASYSHTYVAKTISISVDQQRIDNNKDANTIMGLI